jgi:hypothetical protein
MRESIKYITFLFAALVQTTLLFAQPQYEIEKIALCSNKYDEFSPTYYKEGIVFCSDKKNQILITYTDTSEEPKDLFDLYYAKPSRDGKKWQPLELNRGLNTLFQEGPACFFGENKNVVLTRNIYYTKTFGNYTKSGNKVGIFFAELKRGEWTDFRPFEYNSEEYNVMHPSLSSDGKSLYFASDMPVGYGGFDIWVSKQVNGSWTKPVNLGPNVNSNKNEAFPFIHQSGRLYYASKGWKSRGGYDIFFTQQFNGNWIKPQNMKEPFSSTADDFGFIADQYLQTGYFSSSRNKNDDIFSFKSTISDFESCTQQKKNNYCYEFYENGTAEGDVKGTMKYEWDFGDGTKQRAIKAEHCYINTGKYTVQLNVIDSLTNDVMFNQASYDLLIEEIEQPFITAPDFAKVGESVTFDAKKTNLKNFKVAKYYWDYGDGNKGIGENNFHIYYDEGVFDVKLQLESVAGRNGIKKSCVYRSIAIEKLETDSTKIDEGIQNNVINQNIDQH